MIIRVRKEVVRCAECKHKNDFIYISDFSYGERLVLYNKGTKYAYINLIEDKVYNDFIDTVKYVYKKSNTLLSDEEIQVIVNKIFKITCDKINGKEINFDEKRKCDKCGNDKFEGMLVEPEAIIEVDIPQITHVKWNKLPNDKKMELLIDTMKKEQLI